jgi:hypothetical protein
MKRDTEHDDLIELGAASDETKGGPWGVDDYRASFMLADGGLTDD